MRGKCHWEHTPDSERALAELHGRDPFTHGDIIGQIEESEHAGLGASSRYSEPGNYRCPLAFAPRGVVDPPWLGELKALQIKGRVEWRLYFGEPTNHQDHVVGIHLRDSKTGLMSTFKAQERQRLHIRKAMAYLKSYFKQNGYAWAPFPDS